MLDKQVVLIALLIAAGAMCPDYVSAQTKSDEVLVGPVSVAQDVNGVKINLDVSSFFRVVSKADGLYLDARVEGDLHDLQAKFGSIVDTFPLPKGNCNSYKPDNLVVDLPSKSLHAQGSIALIKVSGKVDVWSCFENPVPNTKLVWDIRNIGFGIKTKVPVIKTWPGSPIKNKTLTQPFDASLPVSLRKTGDRSAALTIGDTNVELKGQYVFIAKGILKLAGVDVNEEARKALTKAIDPNTLIATIPEEYAALNPVISSAVFGERNGTLMTFASLSAKIPVEKLNEFVRALVDHSKTKK